MYSDADHALMSRALELARHGLYTTTPNPRVGCVIVRDNAVVGEGWHRRTGEPHAEILALAEAGDRARGATVYVTLEPCSHQGRTPPCTDLLIESRVARVIAAMEDPNPLVNGQGLERLRAAGIDVRCGLMAQEAQALNVGFIARMTRGRPWLRLKVAATLDGVTALPDGRSQWITSEEARNDGHRWRARACALLTGIGTVKADNPRLTVRAVATARQPDKVLIDSRLEVNPAAELFRDSGALVIHALAEEAVGAERRERLRDAGCELLSLPNEHGKVDLFAAMQELGRREYNEVHVEAGARLNGSLVAAGCVDEVLAYVAPALLGRGLPGFDMPVVDDLQRRVRLRWLDVDRTGEDLRLRAAVLPAEGVRVVDRP
ncbi:MAG: bifunctional diaminohydroxyphosphoribosylaminopyrimidine deaminase/5-amino-6-(5-phosphoribosylamino)uracil reductase RibD [Lautropia sp.]